MFPVLWVNAFHHDKSLFRRDRFYAIDSGGFLALIFLRDPSYCQQSGCSGLHQQFLQCVDRLSIATAFGFEDAFLYAVDVLFELAPGQLVPTFTLKVERWLF